MPKKRYAPEEIVAKLRQVDVLVSEGQNIACAMNCSTAKSSTRCASSVEGDTSLLNRWREEAEKAGRRIERIVVAFEAGRDGFWLARWLKARSIDAH